MFLLVPIAFALHVVRIDDREAISRFPDILVDHDLTDDAEGGQVGTAPELDTSRSHEIAFADLKGIEQTFDPERHPNIWSKNVEYIKTLENRGAGGSIYLVRSTCDKSREYVVKLQLAEEIEDVRRIMTAGNKADYPTWVKEVNREVWFMLKFNSPEFVRILDYGRGYSDFLGVEKHLILMEAADGDLVKYTDPGNIFSTVLDGYKGLRKANSWRQIAVFMADLLEGIEQMHSAGAVHRDLKPGNVLVKCEGHALCHAKIADFGLSCMLNDEDCAGVVGTELYIAPELMTSKAPALSNDIWALGVIMYKLIFKAVDDATRHDVDYINNLPKESLRKRMRDAPPDVLGTMHELLTGLLQPQPAQRFSAAGALSLFQSLIAGLPVEPLQGVQLPDCWIEEPAPLP